MVKLFGCSILLFLSTMLTFGQQTSTDSILSGTQISLITCDPGGDLYSLFGHSAIRIFNKEKKYDVVYNYGTFDFNTPGFMVKFMRGKLPYKLSAYSYQHFLIEYNHDRRGVREQVFIISDSTKANIISFLENNALPQNAFYKYDFFYDNCSTRIREALEQSLPIRADYVSKEDVTFRDLLHQYLTGHAWLELGIDMIIGSGADLKANSIHQQFLPEKMHDILGDVRYGDQKLLDKSHTILNFDEEKEARKRNGYWHPMILNVIMSLGLILLLLFGKHAWFARIFELWKFIALFSALLIILLWFGTDHIACRYNWNLLWLNPLYLLLLIRPFKKSKILIIILIVFALVALINEWTGWIPQDMPALSLSFFFILLVGKYYLVLKNGSAT